MSDRDGTPPRVTAAGRLATDPRASEPPRVAVRRGPDRDTVRIIQTPHGAGSARPGDA